MTLWCEGKSENSQNKFDYRPQYKAVLGKTVINVLLNMKLV